MIRELREQFNNKFTEEKYQVYLKELDNLHPGMRDFRIAETPVFVPKDFKNKMLDTCEQIVDLIKDARFKSLTEKAIPKNTHMANENDHPHFIVFDFGICENSNNELQPMMIEMQGFPTLFGFQTFHSSITKKYADCPANLDTYLNGYNEKEYVQLLKDIIIGKSNPENVILLDIFPEQQKTKIDFYFTEDLLGIKTVCLTKLLPEGDKLYYLDEGRKIRINRIYNRIIFDDLHQQKELNTAIDLNHSWDIEWITHPNWFYRISKFTLPFIHHPFIPKTFFLNEIKQIPADLENYVLKPLFSFAGTGVVIDVTLEDINQVKDPWNWILQEKVKYANAIQTPDLPAKGEIRIFYFWKDEWERPVAVHNLARLSKGKMIGTRFNKDNDWVGTSVAIFEK